MTIKKAIGIRGSWYAKVDGDLLPCVHRHWWVKDARYNDTGLKPSTHNSDFVLKIREARKVILTNDKPYTPGSNKPFERTGYIAVWTVDDVEFDDTGLRFRFSEKVCDLK
jgi:hypothetical protein